MKRVSWTTKVLTLAIAGQGVAYALSVLLARRLRVEGFEAYVVASAAFIVMVTLAPRGFDKYALQLLPALLDRADWGRAYGYLKFGVRRTLWTSLSVGLAVGIWARTAHDFNADTRLAIIVSCISLPAGALVHFALEVLTAVGRAFTATAIFRIAVPTMALAIVCLLFYSPIRVSGTLAVACWGVAWTVALVMMAIQIRRALPPETLRVVAIEEPSVWERNTWPFGIYRISLALIGQAGVIALAWLNPSASAVGAYAAAMGTAGLAQVLATATSRVYARQLSVLLERRDLESVLVFRRKRLQWLAIPLTIYLVGVLVFTNELLAFFRPAFVKEGVVALRLLALVFTFVVVFALAPTYMKFRRQNRAIYTTVATAAAVQIVLLLILVPHLGATGAAIAYAVATCGMYGNFARLAHRELTHRAASTAQKQS